MDLRNDITQTITNGNTSQSPSSDAVFDALALKQNPITLTTTGSGAATFIADTLNIPTPTSGLTVGTTPITSGVAGSVLFEGAGNVVQEDSALFWDNTNKRLQLSGATVSGVRLTSGTRIINLENYSSDANYLTSTGSTFIIRTTDSNNLEFRTNNTRRASIDLNGNLSIGTTGIAGARLDVRAQGALSTDIAFRVRNSADSANILTVQGDGDITLFRPTSIFSAPMKIFGPGGSTIAQFQHEVFGSIALGLGATFDFQTFVNVVIGASANTTGGAGAIAIGGSAAAGSTETISIGYTSKCNGAYGVKIGTHQGASIFGGTNSIHLGRTTSGNNVSPDNVFMTYFNSQSSSTLTRSNGSFGLLGQQAYILQNGTGIYGTDTFMGNGGNTFVVRNHTSIPSINIIDSFQQYSADIVAGNAAPHFRTENGGIIKLYKETTAVTASTLVSNLGTPLTDTDTFDGYTLKQIVKALRNQGLLT